MDIDIVPYDTNTCNYIQMLITNLTLIIKNILPAVYTFVMLSKQHKLSRPTSYRYRTTGMCFQLKLIYSVLKSVCPQ
jgi:hypothetical protein